MLSPTPPSDLRDLNLDDLPTCGGNLPVTRLPVGRSARGRPPPAGMARRTSTAATLVARPPFERASKPGSPPIHALRLGNARYPHMKLQIQPWPTPVGYMLSVNTHDQVLGLDPTAADAEAFRALQAENARIKEAIELAWDEAGLPTFLRYLRDYLERPSDRGLIGRISISDRSDRSSSEGFVTLVQPTEDRSAPDHAAARRFRRRVGARQREPESRARVRGCSKPRPSRRASPRTT